MLTNTDLPQEHLRFPMHCLGAQPVCETQRAHRHAHTQTGDAEGHRPAITAPLPPRWAWLKTRWASAKEAGVDLTIVPASRHHRTSSATRRITPRGRSVNAFAPVKNCPIYDNHSGSPVRTAHHKPTGFQRTTHLLPLPVILLNSSAFVSGCSSTTTSTRHHLISPPRSAHTIVPFTSISSLTHTQLTVSTSDSATFSHR